MRKGAPTMIMNKSSFHDGVWPVVLTPFREDGAIDFPAYRKLLEYYISEGVAGLFAVCLSSELYELSPGERLDLAREALAVSAGRVPVVGCGYLGNSREEKLQSVFDMAALGVDAVVISSQHSPEISQEQLHADIKREVIEKVIPAEMLDENTKYYINPTGRFVVGGPQGDTGLTGRKIIVDTYGGYARHGGGAFSGKDPSKVDRSAAYAARWVAKNIVAAGLAKKCEVELAYAIGVAEPVSIMVDTFGTGTVEDNRIEEAVKKVFDLRPAAIIRDLDLRKPIYRSLAAYGHMGREDLGVKWENTDRVEALKAALV